MAYFMRHMSLVDTSQPFAQAIDSEAATVIKNCYKVPTGLKALTPKQLERDTVAHAVVPPEELSNLTELTSCAAPSDFGAMCWARLIVLKYQNYVQLQSKSVVCASPLSICPNREVRSPSFQLISIGLNCMYSVLSDLNEKDPPICSNALCSLLHLLQSLAPDDLSSEPYAFVVKLFNLLKRLRKSSTPEIATRANACLLSLAVAYGLSELLLKCTSMFLMNDPLGESDCESVSVPENYRTLSGRVMSLTYEEPVNEICANTRSPKWSSWAMTEKNSIFSIAIPASRKDSGSPEQSPETHLGSVAADGAHLFILTKSGLYKVGTGFGNSIQGKTYSHNPIIKATSDSWLAVCNGSLYLRRQHSTRLWVLDTDSLREIGEILLPTFTAQGGFFTDGSDFYHVSSDGEGKLLLRPLSDNFTVSGSAELQLSLIHTRHISFGEAFFQRICSSLRESLSEQAVDFQVGGDLAFLLTRIGKVYYLGKGAKIGLKDLESWTEISLGEPITSLSVSQDSSNVVFRSSNGQLWYAGIGHNNELIPFLQGSLKSGRSPSGKPRRIPAPNYKRIISSAASSSTTGFVTENGRAFLYGRHTTHCHPETGQLLGLDQVHLSTLSLGKTHAVALSRHGHVYTWGLNNLYQCGRAEPLGVLSRGDDSSDPSSSSSGFHLCPPSDHMWVQDVATLCTACGLCSAHGNYCPGKTGSPVRGSLSNCGAGESGCLRCGVCRHCGEHSSPGSLRSDRDSDQSSERSRKMVLAPSRLIIRAPVDVKIQKVYCGNYHTLLLSADGQVFTFGSNCHGQLGLGDTRRRMGPQQVSISKETRIVKVAAGANHSVLMSQDGLVYTFGSNRQGQLGREGKGKYWHAQPGIVPGISARAGVVATWVGGGGDTTLIQCKEHLLQTGALEKSCVTGNQRNLIIFPPPIHSCTKHNYLVVERKACRFQHFKADVSQSLQYTKWTLDPCYNVLWASDFKKQTLTAYSTWNIGSEIRSRGVNEFVRSPEFWIPGANSDSVISISQMGLSALSTIYALTLYYEQVQKSEMSQSCTVVDPSLKNGEYAYRSVDRFANYGGGWGYSAQSVEAVQFQPSQDIQVLGLGLYGGRGEYVVRLKLLRLVGQDYDERNLEILSESDEMIYDCASREKAHLFFPRPIRCTSGHWYIAWAQINGPSSDCGAGGQTVVVAEDGVSFQFRNSRLSNNGTDVHVGQIPCVLYRANGVSPCSNGGENNSQSSFDALARSVKIRSLLSVTPEGLRICFKLLSWVLEQCFQNRTNGSSNVEPDVDLWRKERLVVIGVMTLRLIRFYLEAQKPDKSQMLLTVDEASMDIETVGDELVQLLNDELFSKSRTVQNEDVTVSLLEEAVSLHVECFSHLFPSATVVRDAMTELMQHENRSSWSLVALLSSLSQQPNPLALVVGGYDTEIRDKSCARDGKVSTYSNENFNNFLRFIVELVFAPSTPVEEGLGQSRLRDVAGDLLVKICQEIVTSSENNPSVPILQTPTRFKRISSQQLWENSIGAPDAISFRVDGAGIELHGIGAYTGCGAVCSYNLEILVSQGDGQQETWQVLEKSSGHFSAAENTCREISLLRLPKPVKLQSNSLYAVRFYWQNGKTWCGEGGTTSVKLINNCRITFQQCSLSLNGTNVARGQIPSLLYSTSECGMLSKISSSAREQHIKWFLQVVRALSCQLLQSLTSGLIPCQFDFFSSIFGWISVFLHFHPKKALEVLNATDEILPVVAAANSNRKLAPGLCPKQQTQTVVESEHPYKPAQMTSYVIRFDQDVKYVSLEFDHLSCTAQQEDTLCVYWSQGDDRFQPLASFGGSRNWPNGVITVPGNIVWLILETVSGSEKVPPERLYGFKCVMSGCTASDTDPLVTLEQELTWICSTATRLLAQKNEDTKGVFPFLEEENEMIKKHGGLLRKGLALSHTPNMHEVLNQTLPGRPATAEMKFLSEFITASGQTVAGRLARWLSPEPFIDLQCSELIIESQNLQSGQPQKIMLLPKDQYSRVSIADELSVEVTVRFGASEFGTVSTAESTNFPSLMDLQTEAYQPTYMNKARYISVSMMPRYHGFSFEELRLGYFRDTVLRESIRMTQDKNGAYVGSWVPRQGGTYLIECRLDGFQLSQSFRVEVGETSARLGQSNRRKIAQLSRARIAVCSTHSACQGVRIRSSPGLQSPTIGVIPRGSAVSYIEEMENTDGMWLRLTDEAAVLYCDSPHFPSQAWCLQYSRALQRVLMSRESEDDIITTDGVSCPSVIVASEESYAVTATENIFVFLNPNAGENRVVGSVPSGEHVTTVGWLQNTDGIWIRLSNTSLDKYCSAKEMDGFCLAQDSTGKVFLELLAPPRHNEQQEIANDDLNIENGNPLRPASLPTTHKRPSSGRSGKPTAQVWPQPGRAGCPSLATQPSIADCARSVFAAVLWHEHLVQDAMALSNFLRFHRELHHVQFRQQHSADLINFNVPKGLQLLARLWQEVNAAVLASIQQHLILPSPPMAIPSQPCHLDSVRPLNRERSDQREFLCELCQGWYPTPISAHMRVTHPGCGSHAGGQGFNSEGRYTSGWTGRCGDGGRGPATWYLLCQTCRRKYLQLTPGGQLMERSRRARQLRMAVGTMEPQYIMKQNSMFLLELNSSVDNEPREQSCAAASGWTINLFPETKDTSGTSSVCPTSSKAISHASDPGPKRQLSAFTRSVPSCSEPTSRYGAPSETNSSFMRESGVFLASPSTALKALAPSVGDERSVSSTLKKPVLAFVIQHHDLKRVRQSMRSSVCRATLFSHAFRVWNWLLRTVSTESSVYDILWTFLSAMASYASFTAGSPNSANDKSSLLPHGSLLPHPWRLCLLAGNSGGAMLRHFHAFLRSVSTIDTFDPALRRLCFRAWMFQLTPHEQDLILSCQLLSSVGRVMSEQEGWKDTSDSQISAPDVEVLEDLTKATHVETSSRSAMSVCLTDGTTETFWESGEEDKNKAKIITLNVSSEAASGILLAIYVDNVRDETYRTSQVSISVPSSGTNSFRKKLITHVLDSQFKGWMKCCIAGFCRFRIEFKGPDPYLRVRLVQISGRWTEPPPAPLKPSPSHLLQFSAAQADAFAVFQTIASQAFSNEFIEDQAGTLKQQVLDILFSRIQLQPLQGYVCAQVVLALEREIFLLRDQTKRNYSYCSGLLGMLSRICHSRCGKEVFKEKKNLLPILSELLLFASPIVQCLVLDTIEKLLTIFDPDGTDAKTLVLNLLAVITKVITVQVRDRSVARSAATATLQSALGAEAPKGWRLDRQCSSEIGRMICSFLVEVSCSKFGESWSACIKTEIANNIMNLAATQESERSLERCLKQRRFWLALGALSVLRDVTWLESSPSWRKQSNQQNSLLMCENHDDGKTEAHLYCQVCRGSFCRACYTILHLNRRNRNHTIQMIAGNESRPEINVHEGCTRLRMSWLLCLLDSATLNGMVEFTRNRPEDLLISADGGTSGITKLCRFCQNPTESELNDICEHADCQAMAATACTKLLSCGHLCGGVSGEDHCLPCLRCRKDPCLRQDADDLCVICFTDRLGAAPSIQLSCSHVFHAQCCKATLSRKWSGPRITFGHMRCPLCQQLIQHPSLASILQPLNALLEEVSRKALLRLEFDGLTTCPAITAPSGPYHNDPASYAMDRYVYVLCHKCGRAYFGGEAQCQDALSNSEYNPEELLCGACSDVSRAQICPRHGSEFLEYKCRYCCSVAVFFCFGTTHFCSQCHEDFQRLLSIPMARLPQCPVAPRAVQLESGQCPLKVDHPPTGEEFALGCGICRNISTF